MKSILQYVQYVIRPQKDGSYAILEKDKSTKKVDIHSTHDTLEEAQDALADLHTRPTQAETRRIFHNMQSAIKRIN